MKYNVSINNKTFHVDIKKTDSKWLVRSGKQTFTFSDMHQLGSTLWSLTHHDEEIFFETDIKENQVSFWLNNQKITASVQSSSTILTEKHRTPNTGHQKLEIRSMMPGLIKTIHIQPGDTIKQGDPLLVLEAMKMENEIESPRNGTIAQIYVHENQSVESNTLLIELNE